MLYLLSCVMNLEFKLCKGSIILLKYGWKKFAENNHNHLRSNNYDICTAEALRILNIFRCYGPRKYILLSYPMCW
jgi:hypothetical protein